MEGEDDRLVGGEERDPFLVAQTVRMLTRMNQLEQINDVDAADPEVGEVLQ